MRICLSVSDNNGAESSVYGHFGSAPFFAVYDTESEAVSIVNNNQSEHTHGSCMPVDALRDIKADVVLSGGMGLRAANLLLQAGIKPFLVEAKTVADAITAYKEGCVRALDAQVACQSHGCH